MADEIYADEDDAAFFFDDDGYLYIEDGCDVAVSASLSLSRAIHSLGFLPLLCSALPTAPVYQV